MTAGYYVTACREDLQAGDRPAMSQRVAWLLGPFESHQEAVDRVDEVRDECEGITAGESAWWSFGTARREGGELPPGKLNDRMMTGGAA